MKVLPKNKVTDLNTIYNCKSYISSLWSHAWHSVTLTDKLNWIVALGHKLAVTKYDINNTRFVQPEVGAAGFMSFLRNSLFHFYDFRLCKNAAVNTMACDFFDLTYKYWHSSDHLYQFRSRMWSLQGDSQSCSSSCSSGYVFYTILYGAAI